MPNWDFDSYVLSDVLVENLSPLRKNGFSISDILSFSDSWRSAPILKAYLQTFLFENTRKKQYTI